MTETGKQSPQLDGVRVLVLFGGSEWFGQERANLEVFRSLSELGLKVRFVTSSRWGAKVIQPELSRLGFEWTTAPFGFHWGRYLLGRHFYYVFFNLWGVLATSWRVWREARRWGATHIYAPNWMYWVYAALGIRWLGLSLVYRAGDQLPWHSCFHRWTGGKLLNAADHLVCNCEFLRQRFLSIGLKADKARVIYNYPPFRSMTTTGDVPLVTTESVTVIYLGQITEHKGVPVLVEAAERLLNEGRNLAVWIVGESTWGNQTNARLQTRVEANGWAKRIHFLGYRADVAELLRKADVHVCPSVWEEPSPNVVFEAKREGVPSVVFPVGGVPELIEHGVDGYVCTECTVAALAEGIDHFLRDSTARKRAGEAARRSLDEKFGPERFRRQWKEVFRATQLGRNG
jgi:glycosyltransferase involved in cell wall biosynthesis